MTDTTLIPTENMIVADAGGYQCSKLEIISHHLPLFLFNAEDTLAITEDFIYNESLLKLN
jgi:hypothetical protein